MAFDSTKMVRTVNRYFDCVYPKSKCSLPLVIIFIVHEHFACLFLRSLFSGTTNMDVQNLLNHEDTIALLYADGSGQNDARQCIMNSANAHLAISDRSSRFERRREDEYLPRTSRGQTPPDLDLGRGDPVNGPCLWLRFSRGSKSRMGIVAGCNPNSDIVLPPRRGISWYHFAIQFDQNYNLVIADMDSTCGTTVTYDSHNPGPRVSAKWIIGGNPYLSAVSKITVRASGARFLVKIPRRNPLSSAYRAQVDCFRQSASLNPNFADLQLSRSRPDTRRPTGSHTPTTNPIRIKHELGRGSFGVVYKVWDATTGQLWAEKNALGESFSRSDWKREIDIIRGLNHVSTLTKTKSSFLIPMAGSCR